ncbi:MAG TPA: NepR family anti-sigma factor [Xanthobacteraceae bacterium]|nr:NepR family anti-sigma factor [Xanthobacteraceae bacterium]
MNRSGPSQRKTKADVRGSETVVKLGPDIKAKIGQQLRLMYSEVVDQGVPERFVEMLKRLDEATDEGIEE